MAVNLPDGAVVSIASGYNAASNMTALSNADPAVATLAAAHGITEGDVIEVTSGWSRLGGKILRAGAVSTNDVDLEGINTTDESKYPAGSGVGSARSVAGWIQISQILEFATQGGEQQFATFAFLEDSFERQIPTNKSAASITVSIGDDQSLPWYGALVAADEDRLPRALRINLPSGAVIYYNVYVSINKTPSLSQGSVMALSATFSFVNEPVRYAS